MEIHIGRIIQSTLKIKGITVVHFAKQINCTRRNAYEIFRKDHIDTALLISISKVLSVNLFLHFLSEKDMMNYQHSRHKEELLQKITGTQNLLANINLVYDTQDALTIKLTEMIIDLQAELKRRNF